jgi:hypothetical protein
MTDLDYIKSIDERLSRIEDKLDKQKSKQAKQQTRIYVWLAGLTVLVASSPWAQTALHALMGL